MFLRLGVYEEDEVYLMLTKFSEIFQLSFHQNALQCNVPLSATSVRAKAFWSSRVCMCVCVRVRMYVCMCMCVYGGRGKEAVRYSYFL